MNTEKVISPFQILDWRILSFNCTNPIVNISYDIDHHWQLKAHIENLPQEGSVLRAMIHIEFHFYAELNGQKLTMDGHCVALCEMDNTSMPEADATFQSLLSRTGMTNCLANLRVFLLQAGTLHQMGPKRVMLPFINLTHFNFDEMIEFTV